MFVFINMVEIENQYETNNMYKVILLSQTMQKTVSIMRIVASKTINLNEVEYSFVSEIEQD